MKRILSYLVVAAAAILCAGTLSAQISKSKAPVRQGWQCTTEFYKIGTQVYGFQNDPLYGDIESIEEIFYPYVGVDDSGNAVYDSENATRTIYTFNKRGDVVSKMVYNERGELIDSTVWEYDASGRLVKEQSSGYCKTYKYNSAGLLSRYSYESEEFPSYDGDYVYDSRNNLVKIYSDFDGYKYVGYEAKYDAQNRLIYVITRDEFASEYHKSYKYDKSGRVVKADYVYTVEICEYDANGNILRICSGNNVEKTTFIYSTDGVLSGVKSDEGSYIFEINSDGKPIMCLSGDQLSNLKTYEYDEYGNIVKIHYYTEGYTEGYTERKITYRK